MTEVSIRKATAADQHLPYYSHSIMEAIAQCPKWGMVRYISKRYYRTNYRSMALEAGSAMHDVFAGLRLWSVLRKQNLPEHFMFHGERLFRKARFKECWREGDGADNELFAFLFNLLNTSGFYDDPSDKTRTLSNMEESIIHYVRNMQPSMDRSPIWIGDVDDPSCDIGIELPFDMVIGENIRVIGTIDGIAQRKEYVRPEENKTASRLDEAWRKAWQVKAQVTGYRLATAVVTGQPVSDEVRIIGMKLKQGRTHEDFLDFVEYRDDTATADWVRTVYFIHSICEAYRDDPLGAPMFTHSCNRYFRPCGLIDMCSLPPDDQQALFEEMEPTEPSPSEQAIQELYKNE